MLLIIGIAAVLTVPAISNSIRNYRADMAAQKLASDLQFGVALARSTNSSITIKFEIATHEQNGGYRFEGSPDPRNKSRTRSVAFSQHFTTAQLNVAPVEITFDAYGYPDRDATWIVDENTPAEKTVWISKASGRVQTQ